MKKLIYLFILLVTVLAGCNHEEALEVNAEFRTTLIDNTAYAGETFYIYKDKCTGDFFTLFQGLTPSTTYNADDPSVKGTDVTTSPDSISITYAKAGSYELTLVATSSGNWAEDNLMDVYTLTITVVDSRTGFSSMDVDGRIGSITSENEILFYAHKMEDLTNERVKFIAESSSAEVYVGTVLQESGKNRHDFSALNPGDNEGRPVVYTVKAPDGKTADWTARFILREASSEKVLYAVNSTALTATFTVDEQNKEVLVSYYTGESLNGKITADASTGAIVKVGTREITSLGTTVDLSTATTFTITAEDGSVQDYAIVLYEKEKIVSFNFTAYDPGTGSVDLVPPVTGVVDFNAKTVNIQVLQNLNLNSVIASFTGLTNFVLKINGTELTSGVTAFNYSFDPPGEGAEPNTSKIFSLQVLDGTTLVDTYTLNVHY